MRSLYEKPWILLHKILVYRQHLTLQLLFAGSLTCDDRREFPPVEPPTLLGSTKLPDMKGLKQDADEKVEGQSSNSHNLVAASGSNKAASSDGKGKAAADRKKKRKKKYLCFMPF